MKNNKNIIISTIVILAVSVGQWWKFTINGQYSLSGIDSTPIKDGDKIEFTFTIGW